MNRSLKQEWRFAASAALLERGCVNIIELEAFKTASGPRWAKMRASICAHLEGLLRQKLSAAGFFVQLDDTSYLVSAPSSTQEEAQVFCIRLAHELHTNLLGPCDLGQIRIARAARLDGDVLECASVIGAELQQLAVKAGLPCSGSVVPLRAVPHSFDSEESQPHPKFAPVWDAQKEAVTAWRCLPVEERAAATSTLQAKLKRELGSQLSRLRFATSMLAERLEAGERFLLSIPISYELLGSPVARMELAAACRGLSSTLRPYLKFEITELPHGVPQSRLSDLVIALAPFCRGVWAHLPPRVSGYGAFQCKGLTAVGISLAPANIGPAEIGGEVFKLCAVAQRLHLRPFVTEVAHHETLAVIRGLGAHLVSGPVIGAPQDRPSGVYRLPAREIEAHARDTFAVCSARAA